MQTTLLVSLFSVLFYQVQCVQKHTRPRPSSRLHILYANSPLDCTAADIQSSLFCSSQYGEMVSLSILGYARLCPSLFNSQEDLIHSLISYHFPIVGNLALCSKRVTVRQAIYIMSLFLVSARAV